MILGLFILSIGMVSAAEATIITGTVYAGSIDNGVEGLDVLVTCNGGNASETTGENGEYSVAFDGTVCDFDDTVRVDVTQGGEVITEYGQVTMENNDLPGLTINVDIVDVMVPEFGGE